VQHKQSLQCHSPLGPNALPAVCKFVQSCTWKIQFQVANHACCTCAHTSGKDTVNSFHDLSRQTHIVVEALQVSVLTLVMFTNSGCITRGWYPELRCLFWSGIRSIRSILGCGMKWISFQSSRPLMVYPNSPTHTAGHISQQARFFGTRSQSVFSRWTRSILFATRMECLKGVNCALFCSADFMKEKCSVISDARCVMFCMLCMCPSSIFDKGSVSQSHSPFEDLLSGNASG